MAFIPVPNTVLVEIIQTLHTSRIENTLYFTRGDPWDVGTAEDLGDGILNWWTTEVAPLISEDVLMQQVDVTDLEAEDSFKVTRTPVSSVPGEVGADSIPANCAICVTFKTSKRGRSFTGRNYISGWSENDTADSTLAGTPATGIIAAYQAIPSYVSSTLSTHSVVSRFHAGDPRVTGVSTPVSTYVLTDLVLDSQRRRLPGRGT